MSQKSQRERDLEEFPEPTAAELERAVPGVRPPPPPGLDERIAQHPEVRKRIAEAQAAIAAGEGVRLEDL